VRNGWRIVARNVRHGRGEIDIIATRGRVVAVCEVKARRNNDFGGPGDAMTPSKCRTVRVAAFGWARERGISATSLRFDVALVVGSAIEVLEDAF
jgi:putative endonuclease